MVLHTDRFTLRRRKHSAADALAARLPSSLQAGRDHLIAGIIGLLIVAKEVLALAACAMLVLALMAGGLAVANDKRTVVEPPHIVREAAR